ncbi:Hypothetical predicted protein [Cloeon dipterum]|uniref:Uncharacterized protein n=1 Tax=Cloeon dipterum TaxID=197152 RepID=A0A8S1DU32_9INSE|nr:Hypothetical predicted protein [Cloeon dipterum]
MLKMLKNIEELVLLDNTEELKNVECSMDRALLEEFGKLKQLRALVVIHEALCNADELQKLGQNELVKRWKKPFKLGNAASGRKSPLLSLSPEPAVLLFELRNATLAATFHIHPKSFSSNHKCCPDCLPRNFEREQIEIPFLFVIQNSLQHY